ncbi:MAG TPA: PQQ-dependent sugar dehydrogenase [Geminicoccaceae bacterium]|nr:PQQ-dependent sugar dehydrogenase [Geminicoccaceae bacterium]
MGLASSLALGAMAATPALADVNVTLEEVASGLTAPMMMVQPPGDDRKFIVEQSGTVRILSPEGELLGEPFLDLRNLIVTQLATFDERGLLGLAFHPDFANNGKFYVAYSRKQNGQGDPGLTLWWDHENVVAEYTVSADDPDVADPTSARIISAIMWPQFNHNGHWIAFGPDGMLYISTGDGGYANDWGIGHNVTEGNGQDLLSPLGKILRIDADASGGGEYGIPDDNPFVGQEATALPEIWAYGLRNPWRCSFDMGGDHALFCGNVGQNSFEEVEMIQKGENHGWRRMEATHCFDFEDPNNHPDDCDKADLVPPIVEYLNCTAKPQGCEGISVTGGYVYRGSNADWNGKYIFGDWSKSFKQPDGQLFMATKGSDGTWTKEHLNVTNMEGSLPYVLAFAQDSDGEVYALTSVTTGPVGGLDKIYKIVPAQ